MRGSADAFTVEGFNKWKKKDLFDKHVGAHNSVHNRCRKACEDLMNQNQHIDIANVMHMVKTTKGRLQKFIGDGWDSFLSEVYIFYAKEDIDVLQMEDPFVNKGRSRCKSEAKTNLHHYRVELFCTMIDDLLRELGSRFNEMNMELLLCVACLDPRDSVIAFDTRKLIRLAEFYPSDFSSFELVALEQQHENYIADMRSDERISEIDGISDLCRTMI